MTLPIWKSTVLGMYQEAKAFHVRENYFAIADGSWEHTENDDLIYGEGETENEAWASAYLHCLRQQDRKENNTENKENFIKDLIGVFEKHKMILIVDCMENLLIEEYSRYFNLRLTENDAVVIEYE